MPLSPFGKLFLEWTYAMKMYKVHQAVMEVLAYWYLY